MTPILLVSSYQKLLNYNLFYDGIKKPLTKNRTDQNHAAESFLKI
jgi:hypothetical protein